MGWIFRDQPDNYFRKSQLPILKLAVCDDANQRECNTSAATAEVKDSFWLFVILVCLDRGVAKAWSQAYFGEGSGPVLLDEVRCTGNELSIEQCPKSSWREHNCGHKEDAGVSCTPLTGSPLSC